MQEAGFVPSAATLLVFYAFNALAGLMVVEVYANTVCERGAGAVSMQVWPCAGCSRSLDAAYPDPRVLHARAPSDVQSLVQRADSRVMLI